MNVGDAPLVSICISSYQQIGYLKDAIESVLAQDYPNMDIIIVDDCSTDGSQELIKSFEKLDHRIRTKFNNRNEGPTKTYNTLLGLAQGEFIVRHDGDDLMLPGKISAQVEYLTNFPNVSAVYHNLELFESSTGLTLGFYVSKNRRILEGGLNEVLRFGCFYSGAFTMFRNTFIDGISYDARVETVGDYLFMIEALSRLPNGRIGYLPKVYGRYRRHLSNITNNKMKIAWHTLIACLIIAMRNPLVFPLLALRILNAATSLVLSRNSLDNY